MSDATFDSNSLDCCPCDVPAVRVHDRRRQRLVTRRADLCSLLIRSRSSVFGNRFVSWRSTRRYRLVAAEIVPNGFLPDSRHLVFAVFGIAGVYYVYAFARRWVSELTGLFAALFLAATPMWFGYMFINHKDIPFATLLLASTHYSLIALTYNFVSRSLLLKTGAAIGLLAGTKLAGLLLLPLVVAVFFGSLFFGDQEFEVPKDLTRRIVRLVAVAALGCVVGLILFFPQLFLGQINQRGASTRFSEIHKWTKSAGNDRYYAERYFTATTPIFMLVLGTAGMLFALYRRNAVVLAAGLICGFVFLSVTVTHNRVYDGCRHFLFVYPYFMVLAAYPVSVLFMLKSVAARTVVSSAVAICLVSVVLEMYRLFPYQSSFYNSLVGGIEGADGVTKLTCGGQLTAKP